MRFWLPIGRGKFAIGMLEQSGCLPEQSTFSALEHLADAIAQKHKESGFR